MARINTKDFVVKQVGLAEHCCKGVCDSRCGNNCYCKTKIGLTGSVLSFTISLKDHENLRIKSFISLKLTKILVEDISFSTTSLNMETTMFLTLKPTSVELSKTKQLLSYCGENRTKMKKTIHLSLAKER